jgi:hypothetical protein
LEAGVKAYFQVIDVSAFCSSAFTKTKIRFVRGLVSDNKSNRLSVGTHILPLNKQKMRFVRSQERERSRDPLAQFIHVLPLTLPKILFGCRKENYYYLLLLLLLLLSSSSSSPGPAKYFCPPWRIKISLVQFEKTNIHGVA